ncbi:hypothetical protein GCK72_016840 [Caenorhabditis remanei]|uniref:Receptor L-domain domain-containing protein n=1 Tax=Caenorhabditis remanei TaxID=31234 RepID=A0A6A5G6G8_CAERE|nr:hypothetical protein GCK72_016840 [Caenorhabditis remanei]KAF1750292.1 hypothetical protein GCK72_016840 [Caenorhabditis remanei]
MGCEEVIGYPLVIEDFHYELTRQNAIGRKLASIKRVNNGIIIRKNYFTQFSVMRSLQYLAASPSDGPLLKFENNPFLRSFEFADLRIINGTMPLVSFWNDNFPIQMRKNSTAFQNFRDFLDTAGHHIDPCSPDYFDLRIGEEKVPSNHWHLVIAGSLGALALVIIIDTMWYAGFQRWWEDRLFELELEKETEEYRESIQKWEMREFQRKVKEQVKEQENEVMRQEYSREMAGKEAPNIKMYGKEIWNDILDMGA